MKSTKIPGAVRRVRVADIDVGKRHRKDMGDMDALVTSIANLGLLQPILITSDGKLVAGERRLEAYKQLKVAEIPTYTVHTLLDAAALLRAERDENTCRKEFTPSEAVDIGKALEELERPKAKERQQATQAKEGEKVGAQGGGKLPPPASANGKTRDKVAEAVGMSGRTYDKAKTVVKAAEDNPELQPVVEEMDRTGKVDPAYKKVVANGDVQDAADGEQGRTAEATVRQRKKAVVAANEAINRLQSIGRGNPYRGEAFQMVADWISSAKMDNP